MPPTDFKFMKFMQGEEKVTIFQNDFLTTNGKIDKVTTPLKKTEMNLEMTEEKLSKHRTTSGKLAWIATASGPLSSFAASIDLQGSQKKIPLLYSTYQALISALESQLASMNYVSLEFDSKNN